MCNILCTSIFTPYIIKPTKEAGNNREYTTPRLKKAADQYWLDEGQGITNRDYRLPSRARARIIARSIKWLFFLGFTIIVCKFAENTTKTVKHNFDMAIDGIFRDEIELKQLDKFFAMEMGRQIHRYIKARGSMSMLEKIEQRVETLSIPERERAMAKYINLNRKVIANLDWRMLIARSMANYCDSYNYFVKMVADEETMNFYVKRMKEKYVRFHEVFEENGKYGIKDSDGTILVHARYDFLRTPFVYVDDLVSMPVIAEKEGKMGLVLPDGHDTVVLQFEYDDISLRDEDPWFELTKDGETILWNGLDELRK